MRALRHESDGAAARALLNYATPRRRGAAARSAAASKINLASGPLDTLAFLAGLLELAICKLFAAHLSNQHNHACSPLGCVARKQKFYAVATRFAPETRRPRFCAKTMDHPPQQQQTHVMRGRRAGHRGRGAAAAVSAPPPRRPARGRGPTPPAEPDAAALQQRVRELEAALASSEAERERLAQRVAAQKPKKHRPRGRMPLGATAGTATGAWYPPGVLPIAESEKSRSRRRKWRASRRRGAAGRRGRRGLHRRRCGRVQGRARSCPSTRRRRPQWMWSTTAGPGHRTTYLAARDGAPTGRGLVATTQRAEGRRTDLGDGRSAATCGAGRAPAAKITAASQRVPAPAERPGCACRHRGRAVRTRGTVDAVARVCRNAGTGRGGALADDGDVVPVVAV